MEEEDVWNVYLDESLCLIFDHCLIYAGDEAPGFGVKISWADPRKKLKPYLSFKLWDKCWQVGWLLDESR